MAGDLSWGSAPPTPAQPVATPPPAPPPQQQQAAPSGGGALSWGSAPAAKPSLTWDNAAYQHAGQTTQSIFGNIPAEAENAGREFAALPAEGLNAVLGAPQRVVASRLGQMKSNPRGVAETTAAPLTGAVPALLDPAGRKQLGNEAYAAFHPNDPSIEANAESATGVNHLMSSDPRFRGKAQNFLVRTVFENATDPLNLATLGTGGVAEDVLRAVGRAGTAALKSSNPIARDLAQTMLTNVEERRGGYNPSEIARINSVKNREITRARMQHTSDAGLLLAARRDLHNGVIPEPVRQRFLQEPFVFGTPEMREQAVKFGYTPKPGEAERPPLGLVNYNLRAHYEPQTGMNKTPDAFNDLLLGEEERLRTPRGGFEEHQQAEAPPENLYDRVDKRLAQSRAVIRHRATTEGLQRHVGMTPEMASSTATESKLGGSEALKALSRAQVDALLSTGIPHMRNVAVGGYLSLGEGGMAQATRHFLQGLPQHLSDRLNAGAASHFGVRVPGKYSPARLLPQGIRKASTTMLDHWDQSLRAARLEQLDKDMKGADELEKLDRVNQDLGAYNLKPQYVKWLQAFVGANFPQWHNYIVPTMVGRAVVRHPERVERLARTEQNANDSFLPHEPYRVTLGGPVDEAASAAADPARIAFGETASRRYPSYFGGPSSAGILSPIARAILSGPKKEIGTYLAGLIPFGGVGLDVLGNPFNSPLSPAARAAGGLAGIYTQNRPPESQARTASSP
jgi:hypothetical protein